MYSRHSGIDFIRKRKLTLPVLIRFLLCLESNSLGKSLPTFFDEGNPPTEPAVRPAVCELRSFYGAPLAMTSPVTLVAPFFVSACAQASKVAPVVKMSSQRCPYLIQYNDTKDFEHPVCIFQKEIGRALSKKTDQINYKNKPRKLQ